MLCRWLIGNFSILKTTPPTTIDLTANMVQEFRYRIRKMSDATAIERAHFFSINPAMVAIAFLRDAACEFLHCCKNFVSIADRNLGRRIGIQKDHDV
jgi:hypothetical protein